MLLIQTAVGLYSKRPIQCLASSEDGGRQTLLCTLYLQVLCDPDTINPRPECFSFGLEVHILITVFSKSVILPV
jgi:hypothetical protein